MERGKNELTRQWQLMRDAQTFLEVSRLANTALMGLHFVQVARERGEPVSPVHMNKIENGIKLLKAMLQTLEARERQETVSSEALSVLYALSQGRMVGGSIALKKIIKGSIIELESFKEGKIDTLEEAEDLLEIIASSTSEQASKATSKIRIFMTEAR